MTSDEDQLALAHRSSKQIERTNRMILYLWVTAVSLLLVASIGVMSWAAVSVDHRVSDLKAQIATSHQDNVDRLKVLSCLTTALDSLFAQLAVQQQAIIHDEPPPRVMVPKPC